MSGPIPLCALITRRMLQSWKGVDWVSVVGAFVFILGYFRP